MNAVLCLKSRAEAQAAASATMQGSMQDKGLITPANAPHRAPSPP